MVGAEAISFYAAFGVMSECRATGVAVQIQRFGLYVLGLVAVSDLPPPSFKQRLQGIGTCGSFPKLGVPYFGGPHKKDYSILRSLLGFPLFWETTMCFRAFSGVCSIRTSSFSPSHRKMTGLAALALSSCQISPERKGLELPAPQAGKSMLRSDGS